MKKIVLLSIIVCFMVSCATQQPNCGSKSQKKSKPRKKSSAHK